MSNVEANRVQAYQALALSVPHFEASRLLAIHYECGRLKDSPVPVHCIGIKNLLTGQYETFYCHGNERAGLERFSEWLVANHDCAWVVWNMRSETYGFPHILGRLRDLGGVCHGPPPGDRVCDLGRIRWQLFPDVPQSPDGMLLSLARANDLNTDGVMGPEAIQEAVASGDRSRVTSSVHSKLDILESLWWRFRSGTIETGEEWAEVGQGEKGSTRGRAQHAGTGRTNLDWIGEAISRIVNDHKRTKRGKNPRYQNPTALARAIGRDRTTVSRYLKDHEGDGENILWRVWNTYKKTFTATEPDKDVSDLGDDVKSLRITERP